MENNNIIPRSELIKRKFNSRDNLNLASNLTLDDLARLILFKFGSIQKFSRRLGWTRARGTQILKGYGIPENPEIIRRIANLLNIDSLVLAQLFERERKTKLEIEKNKELIENAN